MNSLYTLALRQSSSLSSDIQHLASLSLSNQLPTSSSPLYSQISTGFTQWDRTIDDYEDLAKREIVQQKKDKALARVARFRQEYQQLKRDYERVKSQQKTAADRSELFAPSSSIASTSSSSSQLRQTASSRSSAAPPPDSFDSPTSRTTPRIVPNSPWVPSPSAYPTTTTTSSSSSGSSSIPPTGSDYTSQLQARQQQKGGGYGYDGRTDAALREHDFLGQTGQALDAYLAQGQAVLGNLASQRDVLKGTQRRLLSAANTLGLSRSTITFIERRTKEDYYILLGGGAVTLVCFWFILRYLG